MKSKAQILKDYLHNGTITTAVGCYDGFTAKLVEQAGFEVALISGAAVATSLQGLPDNGLITLTEMADAAKRISSCMDIPVIADADNGYGNALNVRRAVIEFEIGGCAAIQLEDQKSPKSCGHMDGKEVIPCIEHCRTIQLAAETRKDMLILARTDAASVNGIEDAIMRVNEYA
jgi:2-methylisocitrate lyase-like PEP mutase family enzyme